MDQNEGAELSASSAANEVTPSKSGNIAPSKGGAVTPSQDVTTPPAPCPACANGAAAGAPSYIYALGQIEARCPRASVE